MAAVVQKPRQNLLTLMIKNLAKTPLSGRLFLESWRPATPCFTKPANRKMALVIVAAILAGNMRIVACLTMKKYASALHADML